MRRACLILTVLLFALCACSRSLPIEKFDDSSVSFDPLVFFMGHTSSWGVLENRSGAPTGRVVTDCVGEAENGDGLHMMQRLAFEDGSVQYRDWHMHRTGPTTYEATANDMVGSAIGEAHGRAFHWTWTLAPDPRTRLTEVTLEQRMYLMNGGTVMIRTIITKLGVVLGSITESFDKGL